MSWAVYLFFAYLQITAPERLSLAYIQCDGANAFEIVFNETVKKKLTQDSIDCINAHEKDHIDFFNVAYPDACLFQVRGFRPLLTVEEARQVECRAYRVEYECLRARINVSSFERIWDTLIALRATVKLEYGCDITK